MENDFKRHLTCPWCKKGEVLADQKAKVTISVVCPKCDHVFTGDLDTLCTQKNIARKRLRRNSTNDCHFAD